MLALATTSARAVEQLDLTISSPSLAFESWTRADVRQPETNGTRSIFPNWSQIVARARATQPDWSSPVVTTTGLLENRLRFDVETQQAGNGTRTTVLDGGRALDLIVGESTEIQLALPQYYIRTSLSGSGKLSGFGDWPIFRIEQRLASSPENGDNYVVTMWLQFQVPTGIKPLTNNAWTFAPTLAFGKGWGNVIVQGTIATVLPTAHGNTLGHQIQTNIAFQYYVPSVFWPEIEASWTYYPDGVRGGLNQIFVTLGLVVGRFTLSDDLRFTFGGGYQFAVAPTYRASPLTPAYSHAWRFLARLNFE